MQRSRVANPTKLNKPPITIIAAPRSGTNMLRDMLCLHPELATWPCDEINPIWRYGNSGFPYDELTPDHATDRVTRYICKKFESLSRRAGGMRVVEKTCANSLRVPFVDRILPEARYIFMVRDGRDAVASAMKRWTGSTTLSYMLSKARWVPASELPRYGLQFVTNRIRKQLGQGNALATWGPRFKGIDEMAISEDLVTVCGTQWVRCVESASRFFESIDSDRVLKLRYEQVVASPLEEFERIFAFCDLSFPQDVADAISRVITPTSIGKYRNQLSEQDVSQLLGTIGQTLQKHGYLVPEGDDAA